MRALLPLVISLLIASGAPAQELVDPFVNPIELKEKLLEKALEAKKKAKPLPEKVSLFRPKIPKPITEMKIEGLISAQGRLMLVVVDPQTGETYFLKEGDPVAPDAKIAKITPERVVIYRYKRAGGKLVKETVILNVDTEGLSNG